MTPEVGMGSTVAIRSGFFGAGRIERSQFPVRSPWFSLQTKAARLRTAPTMAVGHEAVRTVIYVYYNVTQKLRLLTGGNRKPECEPAAAVRSLTAAH